VAGFFSELNKDTSSSLFYVDSGDTFFPSNTIPKTAYQSQIFVAKKIAQALDDLGLQFLTPGDQDFAAGTDFLIELLKTVKFKLLISNLSNEAYLPHQKFAILTHQNFALFLAGVVDPQVLKAQQAVNFMEVNLAVKNIIEDVKKLGFNPNNKNHRLMILSHSGMDSDKLLATAYPEIHWIIGAHTQDFTQYTIEINNSQIVQALSRNHHVGKITFPITEPLAKEQFAMVEMREDWGKKLNPNPWFEFLENHKTQLQKVQLLEQLGQETQNEQSTYPAVKSCIQCHQAQGQFWQGTHHSVAFATLVKNKEQHNTKCVSCHSLGLQHERGFSTTNQIVQPATANYWKDFSQITQEFSSIRSLNTEQTKTIAHKIYRLDQKHSVKNNFAHVQCLNCHDLSLNHPENSLRAQKNVRHELIKDKCLSCHTIDQSPEWYKNNSVNQDHFKKIYKKLSCPAL
jgi:hypothetical protein